MSGIRRCDECGANVNWDDIHTHYSGHTCDPDTKARHGRRIKEAKLRGMEIGPYISKLYMCDTYGEEMPPRSAECSLCKDPAVDILGGGDAKTDTFMCQGCKDELLRESGQPSLEAFARAMEEGVEAIRKRRKGVTK